MIIQRLVSVALVVGLLLTNGLIQPRIDQFRAPKKKGGEAYGPAFDWLVRFSEIQALRGGGNKMDSVSIVIVLGIVGGFRSVAADVLWLKSDEWWHKGKADRMIPLLKLVTWLDPGFIDGWKIAGWHWAYNLRVQAPTPEEKDECMQNGLNFLEEGVAWNPEKHELYFELGWTNQDKVGDMHKAAEWYDRALPLALHQGLKFGAEKGKGEAQQEAKTLLTEFYNDDDPSRPCQLAMQVGPASLAKLYDLDTTAYTKALKLTNAHTDWTKAPSPDVVLRMKSHSIERMPDIQGALRTYNIVLDISDDERQQLRQLIDLSLKADMDIDEFQQALELLKSKPNPKDAKQAKLLKHPDILVAAQRLFPVVTALRLRDTVASGATMTIMARYVEADDLLRQNEFAAARKALIRSYERFYNFHEDDNRKKATEIAIHDAFIACDRKDFAAAEQIIKKSIAKESKAVSSRDLQPLKDGLEALESKDFDHATILLQAATVVDTIYSHLMARIYEKWADQLNKAGNEAEAKKQWRNAFDTWIGASAHNASDHLAHARVRAIAPTLGLHIVIPEFDNTYDPRKAEMTGQRPRR